MRYLRMLTNAMFAGALGAAYLTILVLQLNPQIPLGSGSTLRWYGTLAAFYGVHLGLLFYVLMLVRDFFSVELFSPGWISVRLLAWLSAAAAAVAALLMWINLQTFAPVFTESYARRIATGTAATAGAAVVLVGIAVAHYSFGRRGSRVGAALLAIALVASIALPVTARGEGGTQPLGARTLTFQPAPPNPSAPHIVMLALDGASLDYVWPRAAEGQLPNFARVLDDGASMDLATIRPTQPDPVWASVATGMYPAKSGVRSAGSYLAPGDDLPIDLLPSRCFSHALVQLGVVRDQPTTSAEWRARPLWQVLNDNGISTGIVRWPLTYPVKPGLGFLVSDRFHALLGSMRELDGQSVYPADLQPVVRQAFVDAAEHPPAILPAAAAAHAPGDVSAARWDAGYSLAMQRLNAAREVQFSALRYEGLDVVGHHFLRYGDTDAVSGTTDAEQQLFARVLDRYYGYVDGEIGAAIDRLRPGDLLLVVSGFGMQPAGPLDHALAWVLRQPDLSGTHASAPDGFLLAYGSNVAAGRHQRGSIVDVAPTVLYYEGLPIGRDMDGFARADLFTREFTDDRPITYVPTER